MKRRGFKIAGWLTVCAVGGFLLAAAGLVPIKASSGHWPITAWLLKFSMRRSLATHTLGLRPPNSIIQTWCCKVQGTTKRAVALVTAVRAPLCRGFRSK